MSVIMSSMARLSAALDVLTCRCRFGGRQSCRCSDRKIAMLAYDGYRENSANIVSWTILGMPGVASAVHKTAGTTAPSVP